MIEMSALADTGASVSVLPYSLFKNLRLSDPKPYNSNLTMADNTQAKAMGEVRNVRIQIGYQAFLVDFLVLDILVDKELPLLLGRLFLRTCETTYLDNFQLDEEDDWLSCFEVGRDEDGNPKYGPVAPSFLDIEDDMERSLAMEAYFNPFKNIIVFKKLIDFLGSLPAQLKNTDWGNKGHGVYKKIEGDGSWHAKFEVITLSGRKFTRGFKTKETKRKLSGKIYFERHTQV
ncbi:putative ribonuclease H-like domain-containing protein [Tanacetum coccineum]